MSSLDERREALSAADREHIRRVADQFATEWLASPDRPPDPADSLKDGPSEPLATLLLLDVLKIDLERRSERGELPTIDHLLGQHPSLKADPEALVEVLAWGSSLGDATTIKNRAGFGMSEITARFPDLTEAVASRRETLGREQKGSFPIELVPEGYTLVRELKPGGMSRVAVVWNADGNREEVLKLNDPLSADSPEAVQRFREEINIASRLTGQVVPVYRSGSLGGHLYYTMPYLSGGTLRDRLDAGGLSIEDGVAVLLRIARGVAKLHDYRTEDRRTPIVHRDLKPANILFPDPGIDDPRIADLGLAKLLDDAEVRGGFRSATGQGLGTPGYMAAEQILGAPGRIGPAADVYALGAILYEILTGRRPFEETTAHAMLIRTLRDDPTPPRQVDAKRIPADLSAVAMKALKKLPSERYADAAGLADELDRWRNKIPVLAKEPTFAERAWSVVRRYPWASALAALFLIALISGASTSTVLWLRVSHQKARADRNALRRASALGGLTERVDSALSQAGLTKERSDILEAVVADLDDAVRENEGLGSVDLGTTLNHKVVALLLLGRPSEALQASERAEAVFAALPPTPEAIAGLASALQHSGRILYALGRPDEGLRRTEKAVGQFQALLALRPDDAETRFRLAKALVNLGNFFDESDLARAASSYQKALDEVAILRRSKGPSPVFDEWYARTQSNLGLVLWRLDRKVDALRIQSEAAELTSRLASAHPDAIPLLDALATCQSNLGEAERDSGHLDAADRAFAASLAAYQTLAQRSPDETDPRWGVAMVQTSIASVHLLRKQPEKALPLLLQADASYAGLVKLMPTDKVLRRNYQETKRLLAEARAAVPTAH